MSANFEAKKVVVEEIKLATPKTKDMVALLKGLKLENTNTLVIVKELEECGTIQSAIEEDDVIEYNPEDDDAIGLLDATAEDYREYVSEEEYDDEDGEIIDQVMNDDMSSDDFDE